MKKCKGFTLIEIIIVIVILGIITSTTGMILQQAFKSTQQSQDLLDVTWQGQLALQRMANEIREIRSATAADLNITQPGQITFTTINAQTITYQRASSYLRRNSRNLINGVQSLSYNYLDSSYQTTANVTQVRCILINLTVSKSGVTLPLSTLVCPRNFTL